MEQIDVYSFDEAVSVVSERDSALGAMVIRTNFDPSNLPQDILDDLVLAAQGKHILVVPGEQSGADIFKSDREVA